MLNGFKSELTARKEAMDTAKTQLEGVYAKTLGKTEKEIQETTELHTEITRALAKMEAAFNSFNGTIKSIKLAIDSRFFMWYYLVDR